ncbi:MAG: hypothetical protein OXD46_09385 [Chloroflexi bacterium]|nr:hypothetical protein [Chloroflexota bacterium]
MRRLVSLASLSIVLFPVAACEDREQLTPQSYRLDLGSGVVVAFVEDLSPELPDRVAYITHVSSGSQTVVNREGWIIDRHPGRGGGTGHIDAVLSDESTMEQITEGLRRDRSEGSTTGETIVGIIEWVPSLRFGGITYVENWYAEDPHLTAEGKRTLTLQDLLGPELYRVAFMVADHAGSNYILQDGDATLLAPGTQVHEVKGYKPEFRLAALVDGRVKIFEADTNPLAETGEDLIDIRGKVTSIDILSEEDASTVLATIDEERAVGNFVEAVLGSPVHQERLGRGEGKRLCLGFRLADGTSVVRAFWLESGQLWPAIMTDPTVTLLVQKVLP